eukprot:NODE_13958_length_1136_cov_10.773043.p1 GENE.NODE_13958_length_1136_cov_10.773043~~NODE_13958_length_1136_cov_10.773043.p1  ORF type:complete len:216 (+),score=47.84 NODE_13958_length_1136_cov_10.773043:60-707(+)
MTDFVMLSWYISVALGTIVGLVSLSVGCSLICACYPLHKQWTYAFNHVFADFYGVPNHQMPVKARLRYLIGTLYLLGGTVLLGALYWEASGDIEYLEFDWGNALIDCAALGLAMLYVLKLITYCSLASKSEPYGLVALILVMTFFGFRFYAVPLWTISVPRQHLVLGFFFLSLALSACLCWCHCRQRNNIDSMTNGLHAFDHNLNLGNTSEAVPE